jgi:hypothetical protein
MDCQADLDWVWIVREALNENLATGFGPKKEHGRHSDAKLHSASTVANPKCLRTLAKEYVLAIAACQRESTRPFVKGMFADRIPDNALLGYSATPDQRVFFWSTFCGRNREAPIERSPSCRTAQSIGRVRSAAI